MSFWTSLRDTLESAAVVAGDYFLPGSSILTDKLTSQGSQKQLSSPLGEIAQLAGSAYGSGFGGSGGGGGDASLLDGGGGSVLGGGGSLLGGADVAPGIGGFSLSSDTASTLSSLFGGGDMGGVAGQLGGTSNSLGTSSLFDKLSSLFSGGGGKTGGGGLASLLSGGGSGGGMNLAKMLAGLYGFSQSQKLSKMATQPNLMGEQAIQRSMGAQGYQGSGNMAMALGQYGINGSQGAATAGAAPLMGELGSLGLLTSGAFGTGGSNQGGLAALGNLFGG